MFDQRVLEQVRTCLGEVADSREIPSAEQLDAYFATFRDRFGPQQLGSLDGDALLERMHGRSDAHGSLMYWLEFKDDAEFPGIFGGIGGGSALKFGIFQRKENGEWVTGSAQKQTVLSRADAIAYVRRQRDQLLACVQLMDSLPVDSPLSSYLELQRSINEAAPDVAQLGWTHKYLSLLFTTKIDDIHSVEHQQFHLHRLLMTPPEEKGRYVCTWHFVQLMRELQTSMFQTTAALYRRNGSPFRYWRIGSSEGSEPRSRWEMMRDENVVAVGWGKLGDLSGFRSGSGGGEQLKPLLAAAYEKGAPQIGNEAGQLWMFISKMAPRDIVAVMDGATVLGIARVEGDYFHAEGQPFPNRRKATWQSLDEWKMTDPAGLRRSVTSLDKYSKTIVELERKLLAGGGTVAPIPPPLPELTGTRARIQSTLERKGQVILYGPPGTGKTHWAESTARELAARDAFGMTYEDLTPEQRREVDGEGEQSGLVRFCCFHPAYGYEDFIEGLQPRGSDGPLGFVVKPGIFRRLCEEAAQAPKRMFYLIVDEINRGDIPRIFGELLLLLEKSRRGLQVLLPMSRSAFSVPPNVRLIGTMNTADRSIALLDTALRRRFGFVELMPAYDTLRDTVIEGIPLAPWLQELNARICRHIGRDARNLQIGHSYLLEGGKPINTFTRLSRIVQDDIIPLLEEYCYEDFEVLQNILQAGLVDVEKQQVRHEVFDAERKADLIHALLAFCPDVVASKEALEADETESSEVDDNDGEPQ
ncbi:AAA family ATPase [Planctomyces sp. SH-PL14]|uniref:AAA family ATPase n=1 Tax=Planctomyces sp. SH-PL14 TaxID=1632864 RepID=UPI00078C34BA|nr:AAA family ATPase [Planctomyces sp. SH-PL14]AMV18455.1 5-methylcytosine-specific restriction enzyme B [Planctomyces sp. SH-PL14]